MSRVELEEIYSFLASHAPFAQLPREDLASACESLKEVYVRRDEVIVSAGGTNDFLYVIRSGAVDILSEEGVLLDRRDAGRAFGYSTLGDEPYSLYGMVAVEDCLLLALPKETFNSLSSRYPAFGRYFASQSMRVGQAAQQLRDNAAGSLLHTALGDIMVSPPQTVTVDATIQQAAERMVEKKVSSLLITDDQAGSQLAGIVTDKDMRRTVAKNIDIGQPITSIMTSSLVTATSETPAFEAMLTMAERRIHHLPVVDGTQLRGMVATADLLRLTRNDPIFVIADIARRDTVEELKETFEAATAVAVGFIERGTRAGDVAHLLTTATDAVTRRIVALVEEELGAPPVDYCFVTVGSQGRKEIGLASDQDNALVLDDSYDEAEHGAYFAEFSERVCNRLAEVGQVLCPGDMMAKNPEWRMTKSQWQETFVGWTQDPQPEALLHAQTFFDFRAITGNRQLADEVHATAVAAAAQARRFHVHLAALATRREPPLGIFRGLVVDRSGDYANTLDVKKGGIAAVVQMARLYGLLAETTAVGTRARLAAAAEAEVVSQQGARELTDAFELLTTIAQHHQARLSREGEEPHYHLDPKLMTKAERETMRDAFACIKSMQAALATRFPVNSL